MNINVEGLDGAARAGIRVAIDEGINNAQLISNEEAEWRYNRPG